MRTAIVTWFALLPLTVLHAATPAPARAHVWQRWDHALYHPTNNVQGINADMNKDRSGAEVYDLSLPRITAYQEAFVRKVVDTVNEDVPNACQALVASRQIFEDSALTLA